MPVIAQRKVVPIEDARPIEQAKPDQFQQAVVNAMAAGQEQQANLVGMVALLLRQMAAEKKETAPAVQQITEWKFVVERDEKHRMTGITAKAIRKE